MAITGIGALFAALSIAAVLASLSRAGLRPAAAVLGAAIPMSASAAAVLGWAGGASILVATLAAGAFAAAAGIGALCEGLAGRPLRAPGAALALIGFTALAVAGAFILPRIFEGATQVFPLDRTAVGVTGGALKLPLLPLAPRASAVTQSAYLISSCAVFLAALWVAKRDRSVVGAALWAATVSQIIFAGLDAFGWPGMEAVRTAAYQIAPAQGLAGFTRLTGAATEPSQFGLVSAALAAWHLWRWRESGMLRNGMAAAAMAALVAGSLSTTALIALGFAALWFAGGVFARPKGPGFAASFCLIAAGLTALGGWAWLGPEAEAIRAAADAMFADKLASESGVERLAWARQAMANFEDTMGLGAGLGAAKASGWLTALLGQTGLPGAALMLTFFASVLLARTANRAARAAALTAFLGALLSEARVDLGYVFFFLAAATVAAAEAQIPRFRRRPANAGLVFQR